MRVGLVLCALCAQMSGQWSGEGERTQVASGHRVHIAAQTVATVQDERLFSHNQITETSEDGTVRTYVREYWIRPCASVTLDAGCYELGVGDQVTSSGRFADGVLSVDQSLGGEPPYLVKSQTRFDAPAEAPATSLYDESDWLGEKLLSRTHLVYTRH